MGGGDISHVWGTSVRKHRISGHYIPVPVLSFEDMVNESSKALPSFDFGEGKADNKGIEKKKKKKP